MRMPTSNSQDTRIGRLFTPLQDNTLVLLEFSGIESVNEINNFTVKALAEDGPIDPNSLLGKEMQVELDTQLGTVRTFHQIVFAVRSLGAVGGGHIYEFELRPWIWFMSRRVNARIFHDMTAGEIIETVCQDYAGSDSGGLIISAEAPLAHMEYVVQYRESDLDLVRRLMEEHGLNFHCEMSADMHRIVVTQGPTGFAKAEGADRTFSQNSAAATQGAENFTTWAIDRTVPSGSVRYLDYNFKTPNMNMEISEGSVKAFNGQTYEVLDYPGRYDNPEDGNYLVKRRANALEATEESIRASGELQSLGAGMKFTLARHHDPSQQGVYCVMSAQHMYISNQYRTGAAATESYHGNYRLVRESSPIAPLQKTPKPIMRGPQTAVVVEGADGTIDEYGRILLKFHWAPESESMLCRVSQMWAGPRWGAIFTPHAGMEVVVEYLDGDPDRPLVVGCVYNADNMPPWVLPGDSLKSGIKTVRDNRLMFDDKDGSELIEVNARKDLQVTVENDATRDVLNDSKDTIFGVSNETVEKNRTVIVKADEKKDIKGNLTIEAGSSITLRCGGSSIEMKPGSITIKSMEVTVEGMGALNTSGGKASHKGVGVMIIQAPIVNIN
jgi:type VI secretion system secreted protein VgrG